MRMATETFCQAHSRCKLDGCYDAVSLEGEESIEGFALVYRILVTPLYQTYCQPLHWAALSRPRRINFAGKKTT